MLNNKGWLALLVMMLFMCNTYYVLADEKMKQIVCIGDQVTKGQLPQDMIGNGTRWVDRMAAYDSNIEIINAGINDMKSGEVQYLNDVLSKYPNAQCYIIYLGINDLINIDSIDSGVAASVGAKIFRMVSKIKSIAPEAEIAVVAPQRVNAEKLSDEWRRNGFGEHTEVLSDLISASLEVAADKQGARFIDLTDRISPDMLIDGVEPDQKGHAEIARIIWAEISHPQVNNNKEEFIAEIAPPPVGKALTNERGTVDVVKGIEADINGLRAMGSSVKEPARVNDYKSIHVKNYIDENRSANIVTKTAYTMGKKVASEIINIAEKTMETDVNALMEAEFASLDMGARDDRNSVEIVYDIPVESRVESFITGVVKNKGDYETLADAVDWSGVEVPVEIGANIVLAEKKDLPQVEAEKRSAVEKMSELTEEDVISDNKKIIEVWLPELDVLDGLEKAVEVVDNNLVAESEKLERMAQHEVKEVFAATEPIEYTGYAVFVHTGFSE